MMPLPVNLRIHSGRFRLGIPLFPVWLLLLPFALLVLPVFVVACWLGRVPAFAALGVLWRLLCSLSGTDVEVAHGPRRFAVRIA